MTKGRIIIIVAAALTISLVGAVGFISQRQSPITVGLVGWSMSGGVVGSGEMQAGNLFLEEQPNSRIRTVALDDEWDPDKTPVVIEQAMHSGVRFFISSHPSKCAVASIALFEGPGALIINTASTNPTLTGRDDYFLRIIADANHEQRAIARYIHARPGQRLLVLQDTGNLPYTDPAFTAFSAELEALGKWHIVRRKLLVSDFDPEEFTALMAEDFDMLYILAGSFQAAIGHITQLFNRYHPDAPIMLTPWARSPNVLEVAGPATAHIILPSPYPSRHADAAIDDYFQRFQARYGHEPHSITIGTRQALELLDRAFARGYRSPKEVKNYLLSIPTHQTSLGAISFDAYGDVTTDFYFITDIAKELQ